MKKLFPLTIALAGWVSIGWLPAQESRPAPKPAPGGLILPRDKDRVVASIDDSKITLGQLVDALDKGYAPGTRAVFSGPTGRATMNLSLPLLVGLEVDLRLVRAEAGRRKITVSRAEVEAAVGKEVDKLIEKQVWKNPPKEKFIRAQRPILFRRHLRTAGPRHEIAITLARLLPARFTTKEMKAFFQANGFRHDRQVKVAHIFIPRANPTTGNLRTLEGIQKRKALLLDIKGRIKKDGSNFAEVAKRFSALKQTARRGYLGNVNRWERVKYPAISRAAFSLRKGQWTGPVEEHDGFHFIKCLDYVGTRSYMFHQVLKNDRDRLIEDMSLQKREDFLVELRRQHRATIIL